jgi:uncharacterized protein YjbI with pentapeptide repeats
MDQDKINACLTAHAKWLAKETDGERADLSCADLYGASLYGANLHGANLSRAKVAKTDLPKLVAAIGVEVVKAASHEKGAA